MTYLISDIHGCYAEYQKLLSKIDFTEDDDLPVDLEQFEAFLSSLPLQRELELGEKKYLFAHANTLFAVSSGYNGRYAIFSLSPKGTAPSITMEYANPFCTMRALLVLRLLVNRIFVSLNKSPNQLDSSFCTFMRLGRISGNCDSSLALTAAFSARGSSGRIKTTHRFRYEMVHMPKRKPNGITKADRDARKSEDLLRRDFTACRPLPIFLSCCLNLLACNASRPE